MVPLLRLQQSGSYGPPQPCRVLVVDDHAAHREVTRGILQALDCEVWVARDGFEAAALAASLPFDLVIMDRNMPRCDGDRATDMIRQSNGPSSLATIVSHSCNPPSDPQSVGYDAVISKPIRIAEIVNLISPVRRSVCADGSQEAGDVPH